MSYVDLLSDSEKLIRISSNHCYVSSFHVYFLDKGLAKSCTTASDKNMLIGKHYWVTDGSYGLDHVHYQWIYESCEYYHPENESYLIVQFHFPKVVNGSYCCINQLILDLVNV